MVRTPKIKFFAYGAFCLLFACSEGSSIKPTASDRPANFSLTGPSTGARGELLEATRVVTLSQAEISAKLAPLGITARNGVHIYKLVYRTETPGANAKPIDASGIVLIPDSPAPIYPWISLQHGTIVGKVEAPSVSNSEGVLEASQGFITVASDYLGFGAASEVFHPYLVEESYADAGVDMMRAAKTFTAQNQLNLGPLFLRGYSEGGYATMALQKALELNHAQEFPITASAPAAGPYDVLNSAKILLSAPTSNAVNVPFVALSYDVWLGPGLLDLTKVLVADLKKTKTYFSGAYRSEDINKAFPTATKELVQPALVDDFQLAQPQTAEGKQLATWLDSQSLHNKNWAPAVPTRLYHCIDDKTVPVEATKLAYASFKAINPNSPVLPILIPSPEGAAPYVHGNCPGIFASVQWFGEILAKAAASN